MTTATACSRGSGNVPVNPRVGLFFIAMHRLAWRLRVNPDRRCATKIPLLGETSAPR